MSEPSSNPYATQRADAEHQLMTHTAARNSWHAGNWARLITMMPTARSLPPKLQTAIADMLQKTYGPNGTAKAFLRKLHDQFGHERELHPPDPGGPATADPDDDDDNETFAHIQRRLRAAAAPGPSLPPGAPHPPPHAAHLPLDTQSQQQQQHARASGQPRVHLTHQQAVLWHQVHAQSPPLHAHAPKPAAAPAAAAAAAASAATAAASVSEEAEEDTGGGGGAAEAEAEDEDEADARSAILQRVQQTPAPNNDPTLQRFADMVHLGAPTLPPRQWDPDGSSTQDAADAAHSHTAQAAAAFQHKLHSLLPVHACCVCARRVGQSDIATYTYHNMRRPLEAALDPRLPRTEGVPRDGNTLWDPALAAATAKAAAADAARSHVPYDTVLHAALTNQYTAARQKAYQNVMEWGAQRAAEIAAAATAAAAHPLRTPPPQPPPPPPQPVAPAAAPPEHAPGEGPERPLQLLWHPDARCITPRADGNHELPICEECYKALVTGDKEKHANVPRNALARVDNGVRPALPELTAVEGSILAPLRVLWQLIYCRPLTAHVRSPHVHVALHAHVVAHYAPGALSVAAAFPCSPDQLPDMFTVVLIGAARSDQEAVALASRATALRVRGPLLVQWAHYLALVYRMRGLIIRLAEQAVLDAWARIEDTVPVPLLKSVYWFDTDEEAEQVLAMLRADQEGYARTRYGSREQQAAGEEPAPARTAAAPGAASTSAAGGGGGAAPPMPPPPIIHPSEHVRKMGSTAETGERMTETVARRALTTLFSTPDGAKYVALFRDHHWTELGRQAAQQEPQYTAQQFAQYLGKEWSTFVYSTNEFAEKLGVPPVAGKGAPAHRAASDGGTAATAAPAAAPHAAAASQQGDIGSTVVALLPAALNDHTLRRHFDKHEWTALATALHKQCSAYGIKQYASYLSRNKDKLLKQFAPTMVAVPPAPPAPAPTAPHAAAAAGERAPKRARRDQAPPPSPSTHAAAPSTTDQRPPKRAKIEQAPSLMPPLPPPAPPPSPLPAPLLPPPAAYPYQAPLNVLPAPHPPRIVLQEEAAASEPPPDRAPIELLQLMHPPRTHDVRAVAAAAAPPAADAAAAGPSAAAHAARQPPPAAMPPSPQPARIPAPAAAAAAEAAAAGPSAPPLAQPPAQPPAPTFIEPAAHSSAGVYGPMYGVAEVDMVSSVQAVPQVSAIFNSVGAMAQQHVMMGHPVVLSEADRDRIANDYDGNWAIMTHPARFPNGTGGVPAGMSLATWIALQFTRWYDPYDPTAHDPLFVLDIVDVHMRHLVNTHASVQLRISPAALETIGRMRVDDIVSTIELLSQGLRGKAFAARMNQLPLPARTLVRSVRAVAARVPTTPQSFASLRSRVYGSWLIFGPPTLSLNINPSPVNAPETFELAGAPYSFTPNAVGLPIGRPAATERWRIITSNPVACAEFFRVFFLAFRDVFLAWPQGAAQQDPRRAHDCLFGVVLAFFFKFEVKHGGDLHGHGELWQLQMQLPRVREALCSPGSTANLLSFMDSIQAQWLPAPDLHAPQLGVRPWDNKAVAETLVDVQKLLDADCPALARRPDITRMTRRQRQLHMACLVLELLLHAHREGTCTQLGVTPTDANCRMAYARVINLVSHIHQETGCVHLRRSGPTIVSHTPPLLLAAACNHATYFLCEVSRWVRDVTLWDQLNPNADKDDARRPRLPQLEDAAADAADYALKYATKPESMRNVNALMALPELLRARGAHRWKRWPPTEAQPAPEAAATAAQHAPPQQQQPEQSTRQPALRDDEAPPAPATAAEHTAAEEALEAAARDTQELAHVAEEHAHVERAQLQHQQPTHHVPMTDAQAFGKFNLAHVTNREVSNTCLSSPFAALIGIGGSDCMESHSYHVHQYSLFQELLDDPLRMDPDEPRETDVFFADAVPATAAAAGAAAPPSSARVHPPAGSTRASATTAAAAAAATAGAAASAAAPSTSAAAAAAAGASVATSQPPAAPPVQPGARPAPSLRAYTARDDYILRGPALANLPPLLLGMYWRKMHRGTDKEGRLLLPDGQDTLLLHPDHPQYHEMWWRRNFRVSLPQPISDPVLRPADDAPAEQRERYAAYALGNFFCYASREQLLSGHASLWDALRAREQQDDHGARVSKYLLANADSHARTRARTAVRLAAMRERNELDEAEADLLADTLPEEHPLVTEYDAAVAEAEVDESNAPQDTSPWPMDGLDGTAAARIRNHITSATIDATFMSSAQLAYVNHALSMLPVPAADAPLPAGAAQAAAAAVCSGAEYTAEVLTNLRKELKQVASARSDAAPSAAPSSVRRMELHGSGTAGVCARVWDSLPDGSEDPNSRVWPRGQELPYVHLPESQRPTPADAAYLLGLSGDQRRVFEFVAWLILAERADEQLQTEPGKRLPPYNILLPGGPGTGKTALLRGLVWFAYQYDAHHMIALVSFTHRAAQNMSTPCLAAHTTTTFFGLGGRGGTFSGAMQHAVQENLHGKRFIFLDEFSFCGLDHVKGFHDHVRAMRFVVDPTNPHLDKGVVADLHFVAAGDPSQHAAPKRRPIYWGAATFAHTQEGAAQLAQAAQAAEGGKAHTALEGVLRTLRGAPEATALLVRGRQLWNSIPYAFFLDQQHRRTDDESGAELQRIARMFDGTGTATPEQLEDVAAALNARAVQRIDAQSTPRPFVVLLRHTVQLPLNLRLVQLHAQEAGKPLYVWRSQDRAPDGSRLPPDVMTELEHTFHDRVPTLNCFFEGVRYVFFDNDSDDLHMVHNNGATGRRLVLHPHEPPLDHSQHLHILTYPPLVIYVQPDGPLLPARICTHADAPDHCVPVLPVHVTGTVHKRPRPDLPPVAYARVGLPLTLGYAVTDYFAQGANFRADTWIAHLSRPPEFALQRANVYVMVTRYPGITALHLLASLWPKDDEKEKKKFMEQLKRCATKVDDLCAELERMRAIAARTAADYDQLLAAIQQHCNAATTLLQARKAGMFKV